jgi:hypothetical protein
MDFLFASAGLFVHIIFMFKREWLFERRSLQFILLVSSIMFAVSYLLVSNNIGNADTLRMLRIPLLAAVVFVGIKYVFFKIYKRNPEDTFWSMDFGQTADGVFNFLFWVLGIVLPAIIIYKVL